jgi:hypothetical protein
MIGSGKVDAFNAMSESNPISLEIIDYKIYQEVEDGVISAGEKIEIEFEIFNALNTARNVNIYAYSTGIFQPEFIRDELFAGNFNEFEARKIDGRISFITPNEDVINYSLPITIKLVEESGKIFSKTISVFMNPNWRTMDENKISMTVTSLGNIAFDDFPYNNRGEGFKYLASSNMLFEGALMIGTAYNSLSNSARGDNSSFKNYDYEIIKPISTKNPGTIASEETYAEFKNKEDSLTVPLTILQSAYQFTGSGLDNQIYLVYDIINNSENYLDSVFVAMYQDWDIGTSGSLDRAVWNSDGNFAYIYNTKDINLPQAGVKMASNHKLNFWAIDNDGETEENPGVYDGFTKSEKWLMMTSGIARTYSSDTDVSCVIGAGPIRLRAGDTTRVTFVYFAGKDSLELLSTANSIETSKSLINADGDYLSNPQNSYISIIYPNPAQNYSIIEIALAEIENAELSLWDINGKRIKDLLLYDSKIHPKMYNGIYRINLNLSDLSQGQYFVRLKTNTQDMTKILQVIK